MSVSVNPSTLRSRARRERIRLAKLASPVPALLVSELPVEAPQHVKVSPRNNSLTTGVSPSTIQSRQWRERQRQSALLQSLAVSPVQQVQPSVPSGISLRIETTSADFIPGTESIDSPQVVPGVDNEPHQKALIYWHMILFYPAFHCELNFSEYFWGAAQRYTRLNCGYDFPSLPRLVPEALAQVPNTLIW